MNPHNKTKIDEDELLRLYSDASNDVRDIARRFGCSRYVIYKRLQALGASRSRSSTMMQRYRGKLQPHHSGIYVANTGYRFAWVSCDSWLYPMAISCQSTNGGYISEHRKVMAEHLGRLLDRTENVHHIDGDKLNNAIENLELMSHAQHSREHLTKERASRQGYIGGKRRWNRPL